MALLALGILDDHSRLCCHLQWYLSETAEDLVHGLSQAIQKRGLPRALLTDNGSAMIADEVTEGLLRLGIVHELTLPYSLYQNGKQECFWASLEGRLLAMLGGVGELTLSLLNGATQARVDRAYNRTRHRELSCAPVERFARYFDLPLTATTEYQIPRPNANRLSCSRPGVRRCTRAQENTAKNGKSLKIRLPGQDLNLE